MRIGANGNLLDVSGSATIILNSGEHVSIAYTTPRGDTNIIVVSAQHLVMMARHESTDTSIICRPAGVTIID